MKTKYPNYRRPSITESARPKIGRPYIGNQKVSFRMNPELLEAFRIAADQLGLGISELLDKAVRNYLGK